MSLAADPELDDERGADRRGRAREPRRSWASTQPVVVRGTAFNDHSVRAGAWSAVARVYQRRAAVLDACSAGVVAVPLTGSVYGWGIAAVALSLGIAISFVALVTVARGYESRWFGDGPEEYQALVRAGAVAGVVVMTASYATKVDISRFLVFVGIPAIVLASAGVRYIHRKFLHRARADGQAMKRTLVVGDRQDVQRIARDLASASYRGFQVIGACLPSLGEGRSIAKIPVVGAVADVAQVAIDHAIDVVVVAGPGLSGDGLRRLTWALDRVRVQLIVVPDLVEIAGPRLTVRPAAGLSLLEVEVGATRGRLVVKTILDRVAGSLLLLAAGPVVALAALAIRLTSPGPAFYRQTRVGVDGQEFTMWKLRSMYTDAERRLVDLHSENQGAGVLFKMRDDPRVTPVGRFLRRYSLDELPQLLNVVRGDMSLVGPRPPLGKEVAEYEDATHRRLRVRPGLTGLWQVSGRSDLSWEESVRLDLRYVDNWSVSMDVMILWKTVRAVLRPSGAY